MNAPDVDVRVLIVGAGPHGLAVALHLLDRDPSLVEDLVVVDPRGWLGTWHDQFARLGIDQLRSPGVHHPGCDPNGLDDWRCRHGEPSDLPYGIPTTNQFARYCAQLVADAGIAEHVVPTGLRCIKAGPHQTNAVLADGTSINARHVVLAVNPALRRLPHWAFDPLPLAPGRLTHADDIDLRPLDLHGESVVVVGSGLTAGHLAAGAARRGARVTLLSRRHLRESMFDTDPGWLGPRNLADYHRIDQPAERLEACLAARDGGSLPPWMVRTIRSHQENGALEVMAPARVCAARTNGTDIELVLGDEHILRAQRVWLATGTEPDVTAHRVTAQLAEDHPIPQVAGWPCLDRDLRWPGTDVHLVGRPAMIALGPAAGNLWGARTGAAIIADHVAAEKRSQQRRARRYHPAAEWTVPHRDPSEPRSSS